MKYSLLFMLVLAQSAYSEEINMDRFGASKVFCYWGYGVGADETYEYKCIKNYMVNDLNYKQIYANTTVMGKLYCCLYMKYYAPDDFKKFAGELKKDNSTQVEFMVGCKGSVITVDKVVERIETLVYDWVGTPVQ